LRRLPAIRPAAAPRRRAWALGAALLLASAPAAAEPPPGGRLPDAEVAARLAFIEARLERATPMACLWWSSWYYGYMLVTLGEAGVALGTTDPGLRADSAVGAAFATLGVVGLGIADFLPRHAARRLRALPAGTPEERRRKLARAERLLRDSAGVEEGGRSWVAHIAGIGVTAAGALVQGLVYKRPSGSILTFASGVVIAEAQIYTRPTAAIDDWRAYQQGAFSGGGSGAGAAARSTGVPWSLVVQPGGMGVALGF
jgi:hypothetical protein